MRRPRISPSPAASDIRVSPACCNAAGRPRACYVLAHGAGAGMTHPFMAAVAAELALRGIATLRYQFPYMEQRRQAARSAAARASDRARRGRGGAARALPDLPLIAGGKSLRRPHDIAGAGASAAARACAASPSSAFRCIRRASLRRIAPSICSTCKSRCCSCREPATRWPRSISSSRLCRALGKRATLKLFEDADHSFHVPARSGRTDAQVRGEMLDALAAWIDGRSGDHRPNASAIKPSAPTMTRHHTNSVKPWRDT